MVSNNPILISRIVEDEYRELEYSGTLDQYFQIFSTYQLLKSKDLSVSEIEYGITDGGNDGGCDGIYIFFNDELVQEDNMPIIKSKKNNHLALYIIQAKNTKSFGEDSINKLKSLSSNLLPLDADYAKFNTRYNQSVLSHFFLFRETYIKFVRQISSVEINYLYITKGVEKHPNILAHCGELKELALAHYPFAKVNTHLVGADELYDLYNAKSSLTFHLQCSENIIACSEKEFIALVKVGEYYSFITDENHKLISSIFEANVRDYQGNVAVNKQIRETLELPANDENFWWLNNGITMLASEVQTLAGRQLRINEPEIVNGLQTTSEIFQFFSQNQERAVEDTRSVLIRIIVPDSEDTRDHIILATNNQTRIPTTSLRATDQIHRQIEMFFKTYGLFYDRRKNYYRNQGKPIAQIISISFLAQCMMTIVLGKPDYARARPSTLITHNETYKKLYNGKVPLEAYLNAAMLGKKVEKALRNSRIYSLSQITNILFYVLHFSSVLSLYSLEIKPDMLAQININEFSDDFILACANEVYTCFKSLGGTDQIAKGSEFTVKLAEILCSKMQEARRCEVAN